MREATQTISLRLYRDELGISQQRCAVELEALSPNVLGYRLRMTQQKIAALELGTVPKRDAMQLIFAWSHGRVDGNAMYGLDDWRRLIIKAVESPIDGPDADGPPAVPSTDSDEGGAV